MKINIMACRSGKSNFKLVVYLHKYGHYQYNISFMYFTHIQKNVIGDMKTAIYKK